MIPKWSSGYFGRMGLPQRIAALIGGTLLLLLLLYPESETSYYVDLNPTHPAALDRWYRLGGNTSRVFILNIRFGEISKVSPCSPEPQRLFREALGKEVSCDPGEGLSCERRTSVRILNVIVQGVAVCLVSLAAIWTLGIRRKPSKRSGRA